MQLFLPKRPNSQGGRCFTGLLITAALTANKTLCCLPVAECLLASADVLVDGHRQRGLPSEWICKFCSGLFRQPPVPPAVVGSPEVPLMCAHVRDYRATMAVDNVTSITSRLSFAHCILRLLFPRPSRLARCFAYTSNNTR